MIHVVEAELYRGMLGVGRRGGSKLLDSGPGQPPDPWRPGTVCLPVCYVTGPDVNNNEQELSWSTRQDTDKLAESCSSGEQRP